MSSQSIIIIAAMARNRVIGANGGLPWTLPADLKRYRALTMGKPMIMGRRTLDAIGQVLDGRDSVVLSQDPARVMPGALHASSLEGALSLARASAGRRGVEAIAVVGGEAVFRQFLPMADQIELTIVDCAPEGDAFFPELDPTEWETIREAEMPVSPGDTAKARYLSLKRRRAAI